MARGWESKEVESQIESAEQRRAAAAAGAALTTQQIELRADRQRIELSRTRVLHDLDAATNPRYRAMLEASLLYLDQKLAELDRS
jgi:hypothetical protein